MKIPCLKIFRVFLFIVVAVITIAALTLAWFNYQGRKEWAKTRKELLGRGEKLALADFVRSEIPPKENFFDDPFWDEAFKARSIIESPQIDRELTADEIQSLERQFPEFAPIVPKKNFPENPETNRIFAPAHSNAKIATKFRAKDIRLSAQNPREAAFTIAVLEPSKSILQHLAELSKRPLAQVPDRQEGNFITQLHNGAPHHHLVRSAFTLGLRAQAQLTLGNSREAFTDTLLIFRLARTIEAEPILLLYLINNTMDAIGINVVKRGISSWSERELKEMENTLSNINLVAGLANAIRGERGAMNTYMDIARAKPCFLSEIIRKQNETVPFQNNHPVLNLYRLAFFDGDRAFYNRVIQEWLNSLELPHPHFKLKIPETIKEINAATFNIWTQTPHLLSLVFLPDLIYAGKSTASVQNLVHQAMIACALQRWLLAKGSLPEKLDALVPAYLSTLPTDIITGSPMHYRRTSDNTYNLWSVGWNEINKDGNEKNIWAWNSAVGM